MAVKPQIGKILYALLFCAALPLLLVWWAAELTVPLPVEAAWKTGGILLTSTGALLMAEAMWRLWRNGKGLPMNAYPPTRYVYQGTYQLFYHPIYTGFCMACAGTSIILMSPAGLYVLTPVMILLCAALVSGYEGPSLKERFGQQRHSTFFGLTSDSHERAGWWSKCGAFCAVFIPWVILYEGVIYLGTGPGFINTMLPVEAHWPIVETAEIPYAATYLFAGLTPFIVRNHDQLRTFQLHTWWMTGAGISLQLVLPFYAEPRPFEPVSWLGQMMVLERSIDGAAGALPSFHVLWALLAAIIWSRVFPKVTWIWWSLAILMTLSCIGVGVHSVADVAAALIVFVIIIKRERWWRVINKGTEMLANSWREWHIKGFRIINHSIYAGLAAIVGVVFLYQFNMPGEVILVITFMSLAGGALWGQLIEGSPRLLRPFGFYGALLGGAAGLLLSKMLFGQSILLNAAAIALAAPWVQAIGRLRCLVQGCCHGSITGNEKGIRYINEHSRVCHIAHLKGRKIYNTQLYSIAFNAVTGLVLLRLWYGHVSPALLAGLYFILSGCARFVEEAYRGEPQTRMTGGLKMYQWLAIGSVLAGILISTVESGGELVFSASFDIEVIFTALIAGAGWAFAMGMDFPRSQIRFSRLSG